MLKSTATMAAVAPNLSGATIVSSGSDRLGATLPVRPFGKTGESLTALGLGGFHSASGGDRNGQALIETALEQGIRFFDTAHKYLGGASERLYGNYLTPKYREDVFIMSKCDTRDPALPAATQLERSLQRLKTDYIDLWMVHTLIDEADAEKRVLEMLPVIEKAKASGKIRHCGVSGHYSTAALLKALDLTTERPIDALLMPISAVDSVSQDSFIQEVLPELGKRQIAPLAMKTMGAGRITSHMIGGKRVVPDRISLDENQWFVLSLPVCSWVSGMTTVEQVQTNADILRRFTRLTESDRLTIAEKLLDVADEAALQPYREWLT
ncbi:aldo/keto reductase [Coraliomargarita parva]|uniref:aldo/keto reductase n=1 Tax=Coraliomargarita parva TaxID=3014050 RepID=UPI0022B50E03|nr:aldo/keto reductase [Coraliomargarita parva]